jgi:fructokinase
MSPTTLDILGIGNAIVDVLAPVADDFLSRHTMRKGSMTLIDRAAAERLFQAMPPGQQSSGGSAANTCVVAAGLGARVGFLGKVAADPLGAAFRADIAAAGVAFPTPPASAGAPTARCLILVSPDGQRTMNTYLGACIGFGADDVDAPAVRGAAITYLEGYLFDPPAAQAAFRAAVEIAHTAGRQVALSLSDPFCVDRHRAAFRALVREVDILFANEVEICALYEEGDFAAAAARAASEVKLAALTRGAAGSVILRGAARVEIAAEPANVLDTTGAGDAYAAGFLAGLARGRRLDVCGRLGSIAASAVIGQYGARPREDLRPRVAALLD